MAAINTLLDLISAGIMSDTALTTWVSVNYDTTLAVFENCDPRNDPGRDDCPLVVITADSKYTGLSSRVKGHVIQVSCLVYDEDTETTIDGVVRFLAGRMSEEMRLLALSAVRSSLPDDIHIEDIDTTYMPLDGYPIAAAVMVITLTQEKLIGSNPYE